MTQPVNAKDVVHHYVTAVEGGENGCIGVFTVRDGKIRSVREYTDTL